MSATRFEPISPAFLNRLPSIMEVASVPGLSIALIKDGEITWTLEYGVKEYGKSEPISTNTLYQAGSLSKPVFAYAVQQLVEAGRLDLDHSLTDYLQEDYIPGEPLAATITARQVLSHTSGLQNWRFEKGDPLKIQFTPGKKFSYSGEGYFLLQRVVEKVTGQPFEVYMQQQVFRPLGMQNSSYLWRPEFSETIASGHAENNEPVASYSRRMGEKMLEVANQKKQPLDQWRYEDIVQALPDIHPDLDQLPNNLIPNAAGSLLTTAAEYARFLAHIIGRSNRENDGIRAFLTPQISLNSFLEWSLGWGLEAVDGSVCIWHWGDSGIYQCFSMGSIETQSGMVVLTNSSRGLKVCQPLFTQSMGRECYPFFWL